VPPQGAFYAPSAPPTGLPAAPPGPAAGGESSEEKVVDVRVVGNLQTPREVVIRQIHTRIGRPFDAGLIEEDVRRLYATRKFVDVDAFHLTERGGRVVIFRVLERPTLESVKYVGNQKIARRKLVEQSGIKEGDPLDPLAVDQARQKLQDLYREKGYAKARVTIVEGNRVGDRRAVFKIHEGPKPKIIWTGFEGNTIASDSKLRTVIESKPGFLWLFKGDVDLDQTNQDVDRLIDYYRGLGYWRARAGREIQWHSDPFSESRQWVSITFVIYEGPRYKIRRVSFIGNTKFAGEQLADRLQLKEGRFFNRAEMEADRSAIVYEYGTIGYAFADVQPRIHFFKEAGELDLVYDIREGGRFAVGRVNVNIRGDFPHTRIRTVLDPMSLRPGDIIDIRKKDASERRLQASQLFETNLAEGTAPRIVLNPPNLEDMETSVAREPKRRTGPHGFRGQSPDPEPYRAYRPPAVGDPPVRQYPRPSGNPLEHTPKIDPRDPNGRVIIRGQSPGWPDRSTGFDARNWSAGPQPATTPNTARPTINRSTRPNRVGWSPHRPAPPQLRYRRETVRQPAVIRGQFSADGGRSVPSLRRPDPAAAAGASAWDDYRRSSESIPSFPYSPLGGPTGFDAPGPAAPSQNPAFAQPAPSMPKYQNQFGGGVPGVGMGGGEEPLMTSPDWVTGDDPYPLFGSPLDEEPPIYVPLNPEVYETRTGRLMFSVGVNSEAGLLGSMIVDEQNFDWMRLPTSWEDIRNGTAWRGGGQRFRLEAIPGTDTR
jgi:outer membrane protein insertion porin family